MVCRLCRLVCASTFFEFYQQSCYEAFLISSSFWLWRLSAKKIFCVRLFYTVKLWIFWNVFIKAYKDNILQQNAIQLFAWLFVKLLSLFLNKVLKYYDLMQDLIAQKLLLSYSHFEIQTMSQKIKHILSTLNSSTLIDDECGFEDRHDNDFVNFRQIFILLTADELTFAKSFFSSYCRSSQNFW